MKKLSILLILFVLFSCSKVEEKVINFKIANKTNKDLYLVRHANNAIYIESKINDSIFYSIIIPEKVNIASTYMVNRLINFNGDTFYKYTKRESLTGSHTINNNIINGRYTSKNSSDFIEFKNYQL